MDATMIVAICGFAVVCGGVSMKIAAGKGRNTTLWAIVGLIFNIPGLLVAAFVPPRVARTSVAARAEKPARSSGAEAAVA